MKSRLTIAFLLLFTAFAAFTQEAPKVQAPPPPAAPREAKLPKPLEKTLDNGLRVIVVSKHELPIVAVRLMVKSGAAADPRGREGLAALTATVLTKGTKAKSAEEIARGVEALGATIESDAQWDSSSVDLSVISSNLAKALPFVADVAENATFADEEIERERSRTIDSLGVAFRQPRTLARVVISRLIFGEAPYGSNLEGTQASIGKITRDDLVKFHDEHFRPDNAVLVLAGDIEGDAAFALAKSVFGDWKAGDKEAKAAAAEKGEKSAEAKGRVLVVDMPEAGQAAVAVGRKGIRRTDAAYMKAIVANAVLGGGYSARLNQEIRIRRGLSYGAGSTFEPRLDVGPFVARAETKNESAAEVAKIMVGEVGRLASTDVPENELTPRKASLIGGFAQSLETTSGIVNRISALALYGLPLSDINRYISGVQAVTAAQVRELAGSVSENLDVVIVGDASKFLDPLKKQFADVEVIPIAALDLDAAGLRAKDEKK